MYVVFRTLDDLVDTNSPEALDRIEVVEEWCNGAAPDSDETHSLETLAHLFRLPREPVFNFCRGMRGDLARTVINTEKELDQYCHLVSGSVGILLAHMFGMRSARAEGKAAALGMAMQRTNILRDIDEDLSNSRVYIANETLERIGSLTPRNREALLRDQIPRADALYDEGLSGVPLLVRARRAVRVAAALEREILRQIEREAYPSDGRRVVVPQWRKLRIVGRSTFLSS